MGVLPKVSQNTQPSAGHSCAGHFPYPSLTHSRLHEERVMLQSRPHPASFKASAMATTTGLVRPLERVVGFYYGFLLSWQVCLSKDWPVKWMGSGAVVFTQEVHSTMILVKYIIFQDF